MPLLVRADDQMPLEMPTLYALASLRSQNLASNTIEQALRSIMALYVFADLRGINLEERFAKAEFLSVAEVEAFIRHARLSAAAMSDKLEQVGMAAAAPRRTRRVLSLEGVRMPLKDADLDQISEESHFIRVLYARGYLDWLSLYWLSRLPITDPRLEALENSPRPDDQRPVGSPGTIQGSECRGAPRGIGHGCP